MGHLLNSVGPSSLTVPLYQEVWFGERTMIALYSVPFLRDIASGDYFLHGHKRSFVQPPTQDFVQYPDLGLYK